MNSLWIRCNCCEAEIEIRPDHPQYQQMKAYFEYELQKEAHPEVCDDQLVIEMEEVKRKENIIREEM